MKKEILNFFNKYKINPYEKNEGNLEEQLSSVPIVEFTDEILEYLISNEIALMQLAHMDLPEKWLIRLIEYDSMPVYRLAYKYYVDKRKSSEDFVRFCSQYLVKCPEIASILLDEKGEKLKKSELIKLCIESDNSYLQELGKSYALAEHVESLHDTIEISKLYKQNINNSIVLKAVAGNGFTSLNTLLELEKIQKLNGAKLIRMIARENLQRRNLLR